MHSIEDNREQERKKVFNYSKHNNLQLKFSIVDELLALG